jgi:hypothetical protein
VRTYNLYPEEYLSKVVQFLETAFNDE